MTPGKIETIGNDWRAGLNKIRLEDRQGPGLKAMLRRLCFILKTIDIYNRVLGALQKP